MEIALLFHRLGEDFVAQFKQKKEVLMYVEYNNNPQSKRVGDCVIRAIATALNEDWNRIYIDLMIQGFVMKDLPSANYVWGSYLYDNGFNKHIIPDICPECYSVKQFCEDNPVGTFVLGTGTHVITVRDGNYYDSWDSGDEVPIFYWKKEVN